MYIGYGYTCILKSLLLTYEFRSKCFAFIVTYFSLYLLCSKEECLDSAVLRKLYSLQLLFSRYCVFFYVRRSNMSGMVQTVEYFGYSMLLCFAFFLSLGTVSFFASLKFIRYIYVNLKMD